jgi:hypothetical protein
LFVPATIGLAFLVAILQTAWYPNGKPEYERVTRVFGGLLLINVAVGVVTGLVQEFEFGMKWSSYSRYVGDVFGAPLAMEGRSSSDRRSWPVGVRLGQGAQARAPRVYLDGGDRIDAVGDIHPGRQLVDAAPLGRADRTLAAAAADTRPAN